MSAFTTSTMPSGAHGILSNQAIAAKLRQFVLPRYSILKTILSTYGLAGTLATLYKKLFDESIPLSESIDELFIDLAYRIDKELFPLDTEYLDREFNEGVEVAETMDEWLPYASFGVAWEVESFSDLDPHVQPMVALYVLYYSGNMTHNLHYDATEEVYEWWEDHGVSMNVFEDLSWPQYPGRAWEAMRALPAPLNGLATLWRCVEKASDNPFLDAVPMWSYRYIEYDDPEYSWTYDDISYLKEIYPRGEIEALLAYIDWFAQTPGIATLRVIKALLTLEA